MGKLKLFLLGLIVILCLVLIPSVFATLKPVSGEIGFTGVIENLDVNVYVEVSFMGGKYDCKVSPSITNGDDGSFSTNLDNLFFVDYPSMSCAGYWFGNDSIWFELEYQNIIYTSTAEQLSSGTGLYRLQNSVEIVTPEPVVETPSSGSSGGGSGGGSGGSSSSTTPNIEDKSSSTSYEDTDTTSEVSQDTTNTQESSNSNQKIEVTLSLVVDNDDVNASAKILLDGLTESRAMVQWMISGLPNENIISTVDESFDLEEDTNLNKIFEGLEDGWYQLRVLVYNSNNELIAISNAEEFFIKTEFIEEEIGPREESPIGVWAGPIEIVATIGIVFLIFLFFYRKKKKEGQKIKARQIRKARRS